MALAIIVGHGHCIFDLLKFGKDSCHFHQKRAKQSYLHRDESIIEDESWSLTPSFNNLDAEIVEEYRIPVDSSFMLSLKNSRYKALDHIFTEHVR